MPESVLVRFKGELQEGITIRDIVHSIPYFARKLDLLTLDKKNKKNIFNGNILEIEGLPNLTCEQAFELSDASAERSVAACTIKLNKEPIIEYLKSNISLLKWMINDNATVLSTSTRNFPNRLGKGANVYLASAELSAITAIEGKIPDLNLYIKYMRNIEKNKNEIFNYMNFHKLKEYSI